jgi:hypothetical protein
MAFSSLMMVVLFVHCAALSVAQKHASAKPEGSAYERHDRIPILLNKVGPYSNPHETYRYLHLPFCNGQTGTYEEHKDLGLSLRQVFAGDRLTTSNYEVTFRDDVQWRVLCTRTLSVDDVKLFRKAVEEEYYFEMYMDGLPMWGFVGDFHDDFVWHRETKAHHYVFTHLKFDIAYTVDSNEKSYIVGVNISTDPDVRTDLHTGSVEIDFTYSVNWHESSVAFSERMQAYNDVHFLPGQIQIHWLSVINSCVLVVLLVSFLTILLVNVVRSDLLRGIGADDLQPHSSSNTDEDVGWKLIHGNVFRPPRHLSMFCAMVGAGGHCFVTIMLVLLLTLFGIFSPVKRGGISTAALLIYVVTSAIGGFVSGRLFHQLSKDNGRWGLTAVSTFAFFPIPYMVIFVLTNSTAWANQTTNALPFGTIIVVISLFIFGAAPLSLLGSIIGRNTASDFDAVCRVHKVSRQIPVVPLYRSRWAHCFAGGILPFSAVYIEMRYVFEAVWGHRVYNLFGILFIAVGLAVLAAAFVTISLTFFQLAAEDHRWWWRAFSSGGSPGGFVLAYSFYFYFHRAEMFGFQQTVSYFGYMGLCAFAVYLSLGFVGFYSALLFVRFLYASLRLD